MNNTAEQPKVSIGMPIYNGGAHMKEAIDSLLSQTYSNFELFISDNASTDDTAVIAQSYAAKDSRVHYYRQSENIGATNNFNWVLNAANGEYYMWAAHDDVWEPEFIQEMVKQLDQDKDVELAFCLFDTLSFDGKTRGRAFNLAHLSRKSIFETLIRFLCHHESKGKANMFYGLYRRNTLISLGGVKLWGDGTWGADMLYVFSILLHGKLVIVDKWLFHKRASPELPIPIKPDRKTMDRQKSLARRKERLKEKKQTATDWLGYWIGYHRLLRQSTGFSITEYLRLQYVVTLNNIKYRCQLLKIDFDELKLAIKYKIAGC